MALKIMGAIRLLQWRSEEALTLLTESVRLRPDYADTRYVLGLALSRLGRFEEAAGHYAAAIWLDPDHADAHANLGVILARQGRFDEAERRFGRAIRLDPDHVNAHYNLGLILSERGRIEPAEAQFAAALRTDPGHANARANLGVVLAHQGRLREAATQLEEALHLDPGHVEARANLRAILSRLEGAAARYAGSLRPDPDRADRIPARSDPGCPPRGEVSRWWLRHGRVGRADPLTELLRGVARDRELGEEERASYQRVAAVLADTHRASSAVECMNSVLRMQQSRHRRMTQPMLDLKRLYWNCRAFRSGPRKDRCPYRALGLDLPTYDFWGLRHADPAQLAQQLSTQGDSG
jgi:tetratricopeptide (TPR) repeat protein